ncbi:MAG: hypothetical protein KAW13_02060 [Dehalococcoidia bacterium]|nr:hypothetical protein [Dehalococcoidia bacterium]
MFENGMRTAQEIEVPLMTQGDPPWEKEIGDRMLGFGGDTILGVEMPSGGFHTLMAFWTIREETVLYGLLLGIAVALLSTILSLLL